MKKAVLSLILATGFSFFYQLDAKKTPEKITFSVVHSSGETSVVSTYVACKGEDDFLATFLYLEFIRKFEYPWNAEEYKAEEEEQLDGVQMEDIVGAIRKIKTVLGYDDQIRFLKEEIEEFLKDKEFGECNVSDINRVIEQFHPVKAFGLKCSILKGALYAGGALLAVACGFFGIKAFLNRHVELKEVCSVVRSRKARKICDGALG